MKCPKMTFKEKYVNVLCAFLKVTNGGVRQVFRDIWTPEYLFFYLRIFSTIPSFPLVLRYTTNNTR